MNSLGTFDDFLRFEQKLFGEQPFIPRYDVTLIRYGEYRFVLDLLPLRRGDAVLDMGCEANIFILYLAYLGLAPLGVDLNPEVWNDLQARKAQAEQATGKKLAISFKAQDATRLDLPAASIDKAIAISSVEHMFSDAGCGDELAIAALARVLKPGGMAVVTLPMSNGMPFHEAPAGDERFGAPYRLYTPEVLQERILANPALEVVRLSYLAQSTPDPRYPHLHFFQFWMGLAPEERSRWAWANPIFQTAFNPIITPEEAATRPGTVNTALVCFRKKG